MCPALGGDRVKIMGYLHSIREKDWAFEVEVLLVSVGYRAMTSQQHYGLSSGNGDIESSRNQFYFCVLTCYT